MRLDEVLKKSIQFFQQKSMPSPRLDAELLLADALGCERIDLYLKYDYPLSDRELQTCREKVQQRGQGWPVAYICGYKDFFKHRFAVGQGVLIPRPDTEILVEQAIPKLKDTSGAPIRLVDFGCGTGCIGLSLLIESDKSIDLLSIDKSSVALEYFNKNATSLLKPPSTSESELKNSDLIEEYSCEFSPVDHAASKALPNKVEPGKENGTFLGKGNGVASDSEMAHNLDCVAELSFDEVNKRVYCWQTDVKDLSIRWLKEKSFGRAHLVVANPPYICKGDPHLDLNVAQYEPSEALYADDEGLAEVESWAAKAFEILEQYGWYFSEIGHGQGQKVQDAFARAGFADISVAADLQGIERVVMGRKPVS